MSRAFVSMIVRNFPNGPLATKPGNHVAANVAANVAAYAAA